MRAEEENLHRLRRERIARTRKFLRWMPRKSNIHKYPVLKWFAHAARRRIYFWSFRVECAVPAIWAGIILSLLPLYGIQIPLALLIAYILKANLPILVSAQMITNPITVIPIYFTAYQIGKICLQLFGIEVESLSFNDIGGIMSSAEEGNWIYNVQYFAKVWAITAFGSSILGIFFATIGANLYRFMAKEVSVSYLKLKELQRKRQEQPREKND